MNILKNAQRLFRRRESFRTGVMRFLRNLDPRAARESSNPLPELTPQRARQLYEYYRQGKYADVMLTWDAMEEVDDTLGIIIEKRNSALKKMGYGVQTDSEAIGDDSAMIRLAEEQKDMLSGYYGSIKNLKESIQELATASFRGFAMLEPIWEGESIRLEPVDQWLIARPIRGGQWYYNADANSSCARLEQIDTSRLIIHAKPRAINIPVMFSICAKAHTIDGWDGLIDVFGNPAIFFEMPPGTSDPRAEEYDQIAQKIIGDGRGSYPNGGKITTVETQARNGEIFMQRAKWCEEQIVRRGTGGLLTVMTESGSGTLAGNAHQETFMQIASAEGSDISECFNKQFSAALLNHHFPGQPHLAYWSIDYVEPEDKDKKIDKVVKLSSAGYIADEQEVSEIACLTVKYQPPAAGMPGMPSGNLPMLNTQATSSLITNAETTPERQEESPLTPEELSLLDSLTRAIPNTARINHDAEGFKAALKDAISPQTGNDSKEAQPPGASPLQIAENGRKETEGNIENAKKGECRAKDPAHCRVHGVRTPHEKTGQTGDAASLGLGKLKDIAPDPASSHSNTTRARRALARGFTARSMDGQDIRFDKDILTHWEESEPPKTEAEKNRRLRRLSEAVRAVKSPHEIWEQHNGQKTYLRVYKDENGKFAMTGFVAGADGNVQSFFHNRRLSGAEKMRKGTLKYKR